MLELAKVIRDLRSELESAITAADGATLLFELGPIELTVSLAIEAGGEAGAKVRFYVVEFGAQANANSTGTQQVKLTLSPRLAADGATPYVSGTAGERRR